MASISFPTTTGNMPDTTQIDSTTKAAVVETEKTPATTTTSSTKDAVEISAAAQAKLLHQQGQSISSIASALGTDTKTVDDYLGITLTNELTATLKAAESASTAKS